MAAPMFHENVPHIQAKFYTSQQQLLIIFTVGRCQVSQMRDLLMYVPEASESQHVAFDFLVDGEFLRNSLQLHMESKGISTETVLNIEYVERHPAPEPEDSLVHDDWVAAVEAMQDYILTGCYDNTVRVWNSEGKLLITIPGHGAAVKCVAWIRNDEENPVKQFVTGSHDETALLWQWNQEKNSVDCVHSCHGHAGSVDCVAVDPSSTRFCSGSWDKMLKIWSAVSGVDDQDSEDVGEKPHKRKKTDGNKIPARVPLMTLSGHQEGISSALWLSDTEICTASWDHTIRIWDVEQGMHKSTLMGTKVYFDISLSPINNLLVAASADRHIRLYDPRTTDGAVVKVTFTSHTAWVSSIQWSTTHEHQFISGSYDGVMKLWDKRSAKAPLYDMQGHEEKILAVDWSVPQYMLSGGADNSLKIFKYTDKSVEGMH
ncbi:hypothetical protein LSH36_436g06051 [Paralvinella palmiformis]|uniref:Ribosome biogenesis protein WDR12 homolog n=1 Tax=Paralvinella palmiformis TaxID=53620 RepID=A0AAD9JB44_9ANNE|nr:hypothetical protein LSH36_436g06051 [Paralvinella palmiformis]